MRVGLTIALVALAAWPAGAGEPLDARSLFVNKCARCHRLYEPTRYDPQEWGRWMQKMRAKARLTDDQAAAITALATNTPSQFK